MRLLRHGRALLMIEAVPQLPLPRKQASERSPFSEWTKLGLDDVIKIQNHLKSVHGFVASATPLDRNPSVMNPTCFCFG